MCVNVEPTSGESPSSQPPSGAVSCQSPPHRIAAAPAPLTSAMPVSVTIRVALAALGIYAVYALPRFLPLRDPKGSVDLPWPSRGTSPLASRAPACNYGGQPYYFVATDPAAQFDATPQTYDMRAFDPRCQPRPLVEQLLAANATGDRQLSIIMYGDRHGVTARPAHFAFVNISGSACLTMR